MYNLSNLEPKFKNFLLAENISLVSLRNYLSDIRHFLGWLVSKGKFDEGRSLDENISYLTSNVIEEYKNDHIASTLPSKTINRRLSALRKFFLFCQKEYLLKENPAKKVSNIALLKKVEKEERPPVSQVQKEQKTGLISNTKVAPSFSGTKLILLITSLIILPFIMFYAKIFKARPNQVPIVTANQTSKRHLLFNGKFSDNLGNPITTKTDLSFKLYTTPVGGKPIYTSSCIGQDRAVTPDVNGNIRVLIGSDCDGNPISAKIFSENPNVFLGVSVSTDSEMKPRQQIPNVGFAKNADTLQGLSVGNQSLTVPYINHNGDLLIAATNPGIRSTYESSNFSISSAETIIIQSAATGDVILQATDSGTIKLRTGGLSDSDTRLIVDRQGNVGIGTLYPSYNLEVAGDLKIGDGNRLILGSSSNDPAGINGSVYYNSRINRFRCFQNGAWADCFQNTVTGNIGGINTDDTNINSVSSPNQSNVYDGKLENLSSQVDSVTLQLNELTSQFELINSTLKSAILASQETIIDNLLAPKNILAENFSALTSNIQLLTSNIINVREKITSPIVETKNIIATNTAQLNRISANEIRPQGQDLIIDLNNNQQSTINNESSTDELTTNNRPSDSEGRQPTADKGPLASLIIKGLEGKTVASIDAAGNASFAGSLTAAEATISGKLIAKNIESENINALKESVESAQKSAESASLDVNEIQRLLAEIKNQPLPQAEYYQNLEKNQQLAINNQQSNNETIEQLTVTGNSNLYNLSVSGSGTIGNILIENNSILSLAWDLKLSALSTIKLFEDAVVISKDGTITTKGALLAQGGIKTNRIDPVSQQDKVTINNLAINNLTVNDKYVQSASSSSAIAASDNFAQNGIFTPATPAIETKTASAGNGIIPIHSSEVIIYNENIKEDSLIYLTPTSPSPTNTHLTVTKKETCNDNTPEVNDVQENTSIQQNTPEVNDVQENTSGVKNINCKPYFKVAVEKPAEIPVTFNWLIIN